MTETGVIHELEVEKKGCDLSLTDVVYEDGRNKRQLSAKACVKLSENVLIVVCLGS